MLDHALGFIVGLARWYELVVSVAFEQCRNH